MKSTFEKYSYLAEKSKAQTKEATNLWSAFEKVRDSVANVEVTTPDGQSLSVPTLSPAKLNFTSSAKSTDSSGIETVLSFLVLSSSSGDQIVKAPVSKGQARAAVPPKTKQPGPKSAEQQGAKPKKVQQAKNQTSEDKKPIIESDGKKPVKPGHDQQKSPGHRPLVSVQKASRPPHGPMDGQQRPRPARPMGDQPVLFPFPPPVIRPPVFAGPTIDLRNKKAFFVIAINGKNYGKIVFELRPE